MKIFSATRPEFTAFRLSSMALAVAAMLTLAGCGGDDAAVTTSDSGSSASNFPTGLSVGVPSDLSTAGTSSSSSARRVSASGLRYTLDFGRALWHAVLERDGRALSHLATSLVPAGRAFAAVMVEPDLIASAALIERIATGDTSVDLADVLDLNALFGSSNNASCYGPNMRYNNHDDGADLGGAQLPSGDLGMWKADEGATTQPCVAAQLNARVDGVKGRTEQGLTMMAVMYREAVTLPSAGTSVDIQSEMQAVFAAVPALSAATIDVASIALDSGGTMYTYRLVISAGSGSSATTSEVIMKHTPGASDSEYTGVMQVAAFRLSNDAAFGCSDEMASGQYKVAQVSTMTYSRDGDAIQFGSRDGQYCGHASSGDSVSPNDFGAQVAGLTSGGELDPAVKITGGNVRGGIKGWRGNFTRFAGDYDRVTIEGDFLSAWQAGTGDGHSRAMAAHAEYNSTTEERTLDGYFAFAGDVESTDGDLLGMICNWAGPGHDHDPIDFFQSQSASLSASASDYVRTSSKITYAPTVSCSSSGTMTFDLDADGTIGSGEGASTAADLDTVSGSGVTVQQEITSRGYVKPTLF